MALQYLFDPNKQFQSIGGVNEVGGFLRVYLNGTDDRAVTYRNFDGGLNEPDIVLDTYGRSVVIVDDTKTYRLEVYNRLGGLMWTISNYKAQGGSGGGSGAQVVVEGTIGEIDVYENTVGGIKYFIASLSSVVKNAIDSLTSAVNGLAVSLGSKKELQIPKSFSGSTTKTPTSITQNENGEMDVNFEDIEFPDYSQRFEKIENEQTVDAKVIAAALNDLNARLGALESEGDNIGDVTADSLDAQNLFVGGVKVKFQQAVKSFDGATNKTVTNISQNENGEMTVTYSPIAFPDWTSAINAATDLCEKLANKKTTFSGFETSDTFYPTLKAVVEYLDGRLQNLGGKKITNNGQPFTAASQLPTTTPYYGQNINTDDYAFVQDTGLASRYTAVVSGSSVSWSLDYEIALPVFTAEQQAAIDSGVNSTKVGNYDAHIANTSNPHGVTYSQVGASPDTHTHQVVINGVTKTIPATGGSPVDLGTYLTSHQDLSNYLSKTGDGSDVTASFTAAGSRNNISTGEKLSTIFGKIAKWFADLKSVAFSGSYTDLSDKPTIPAAANNGVLTIKQNGTSVGTFSANQSSNTEVNVTDTTYESKSEASGGTAVSLVTTGEKYTWNHKQNALPTSGTPSDTYAVNVSGNAATATHLSASARLDTWSSTYDSNNPFVLAAEITWELGTIKNNGAGQLLQFEFANSNYALIRLNYITKGNNVNTTKAVVLNSNFSNSEISDLIRITHFKYDSDTMFAVRVYIKFTGNWQVWSIRQLDAQSGDEGYTNWVPMTLYNAHGSNVAAPTGTPATYVFPLSELLALKANKLSSGNGNLAVIDSSGNYASSGISAYSQSQLNAAVENNVFPWLLDNSYVMTRSFWLTVTTSTTGKVMDFANLYTGEKLLRIGFNYVNDGDLQIYIPWNNAQWNQWIIETSGSSEVGYVFVTANGTKHSDNAGADTTTPYFAQNESTLHSSGQSASVIGNYSIGTSTLYNTSSHYNFCIMLGNAESGKLVRLNLSAATKRYASGAKKAEIMVFATLDASGLND